MMRNFSFLLWYLSETDIQFCYSWGTPFQPRPAPTKLTKEFVIRRVKNCCLLLDIFRTLISKELSDFAEKTWLWCNMKGYVQGSSEYTYVEMQAKYERDQ